MLVLRVFSLGKGLALTLALAVVMRGHGRNVGGGVLASGVWVPPQQIWGRHCQ
jgi:hypothetical protein